MKLAIPLAILLVLIAGCGEVQDSPSGPPLPTTSSISGVRELVLTEQDLLQLGITSDGIDCTIEEYETSEYSTLAQYGFCAFNISNLNDTEIVIELKKFTNGGDLNGSYQYESLHLSSSEGLISENDFGDFSRFRVNSEKDYGGEFNDPTISYYHLWIGKEVYLIHITSKGSKEAKEYIANIGKRILSNFE